jgi:hypothetical protein
MGKCEAPIEVGKAPRCGKPFRKVGVKKTCSSDCSHKLWLEWKRNDYKANAAEILAKQKQERDQPDPARPRTLPRPCANPACPHGENGQPKMFVNRKGATGCSPECRKAIKKINDHQSYLDNPEKWQRSNAKRPKRSRARLPKNRMCDERQPGCHGKYFAYNGKMTTCPNPACRKARQLRSQNKRYADDLEISRSKSRANTRKWHAVPANREKFNAQRRARYHAEKASRAA